MATVIIIDSDILIDAGRNVPKAVNFIEQEYARETLAVSVVSQMEVMVGCRNKTECDMLDRFLSRFRIISLNPPIANKAIELLRQFRLSHGLLIPDALIAATAIVFKAALATRNKRDYVFIAGLTVQVY
ncbi:MAG: type II toxin-antitoxin system VapC family toxin [Lentisphaerae bacterium]|nr:type II toxin-antitoxin system VapC family toxin [Lentisphaerota bacterium]